MQYDEYGNRIYIETTDEMGIPVYVTRVTGTKAKVQVFLAGFTDVIELDRRGAGYVVAGLTAFLADTDGIADLHEG